MVTAAVRDIAKAPGAAGVRSAWLDYAKAIGIALVVFGHASRSVERTDGLVWSDALRFADSLIYAFHMPLFFVLAGYASSLVRSRTWSAEAKAIGFGIVLPYLIWSVLWIGAKSLFPGSVNTPVSDGALFSILWWPVEHMWFLYHLFIARIVWLAIEAIPGGWDATDGRQPLGFALVLGGLVASTLLYSEAAPWDFIGALVANTALFGAGMIAGPSAVRALDADTARTSKVMPASAAAGLLIWLLFQPADTSLAGISIALLGTLAVVALAMVLPSPRTLSLRLLAYLGEISLVIYLIHPFVIGATRKLLAMTGFLSEGTLVAAATVLGLAVPAVLYAGVLVATSISGVRFSQWLGLGARGRSHYFPTTFRPATKAV